MAWQTNYIDNLNLEWTLAGATGGIAMSSVITSTNYTNLWWTLINSPAGLNSVSNSRTFSSKKTQVIKTTMRYLTYSNSVKLSFGMSFSISPAGYNDELRFTGQTASFTASVPMIPTPITIVYNINNFNLPVNSGVIYHLTRPPVDYTDNRLVKYRANKNFRHSSGLGIAKAEFYETDWQVNGYMIADNNTTFSASPQGTDFRTTHGLGWKFQEQNSNSSFYWHDHATSSSYPVGGDLNNKIQLPVYRETNFLTRYIPTQFFNLSFDYTKISGTSSKGLAIYLSDDPPPITTSTFSFDLWKLQSQLIATMSLGPLDFLPANFFQLPGSKYLTFVGDKLTDTTDNKSLVFSLSNIKITGGYHPDNNEQHLVSSNYVTNITDATYSTLVGVGNNVNQLTTLSVDQVFSKIGNGKFKQGVWENGVWNSGWREDEIVKEFDDVNISYRIFSDIKWGIQLIGPSASVASFQIGDKISIGNIVAIDINENRKLLKNYFTIIDKSDTGIDSRRGYIYVQTDTTFPVRRVQKDSEYHRIKVTKNIWLNGVFLNGYFTGNWNNGLFKGHPLITEMYKTNWIDGEFNGGHFNSQLSVTASFLDTRWTDGKVGLTFSTPHKFIVGDKITIDKDDKTINPGYDGETTVISVLSDYFIVTNLDWNQNSNNESGLITTKVADSLVQNFSFYDNNTSKKTISQTVESDAVFTYRSWIDVNYDNTSAVNIGRPQTLINSTSQRTYSENNLYGYPTYEVLSSVSRFRDSFSPNGRFYNLGTKYKVYSDYVGDVSTFEDFFGSTGSNLQLFLDQGWTFSSFGPSSITFSRTLGTENTLVEGKELKVDAYSKGGILDLSTPNIIVNNRTDEEIQKNRYSYVEFDLITYSVNNDYYSAEQNLAYYKESTPTIPNVSGRWVSGQPQQSSFILGSNDIIKYSQTVSGSGLVSTPPLLGSITNSSYNIASSLTASGITSLKIGFKINFLFQDSNNPTLDVPTIELYIRKISSSNVITTLYSKYIVSSPSNYIQRNTPYTIYAPGLGEENIPASSTYSVNGTPGYYYIGSNQQGYITISAASFSVGDKIYTGCQVPISDPQQIVTIAGLPDSDGETEFIINQTPVANSSGITYVPVTKGANAQEPIIHFNNLNTMVKNVFYSTSDGAYLPGFYPTVLPATYLPVYSNIDHLSTPNKKKIEYFYNKRNLAMHFKGSGLYGTSPSQFIIDNLKFVEVDMIPFFKYFEEANINKAIQKPFQGIAPFIDYSDDNFDFIENLSLGFDSYSIIESNNIYSGILQGISVIEASNGDTPIVFSGGGQAANSATTG